MEQGSSNNDPRVPLVEPPGVSPPTDLEGAVSSNLETPSVPENSAQMLDVHAPRQSVHTWKDFFIHIATISVGLIIAISLEQTVEFFHHQHQRRQLEEDLREEARRNRDIIIRDLTMEKEIAWFRSAIVTAGGAPSHDGSLSFTLPRSPCHPGYLGTADARYFAPSEAVWIAAKDSGLVALLPAEQARIYARLAHNNELLGISRERMANACERIASLQSRFSSDDATPSINWTMRPDQVDRLQEAAADSETAVRALMSRLRWTLGYEEAIANGARNVDQMMMEVDQQQFQH
jgi:hypothetical protein